MQHAKKAAPEPVPVFDDGHGHTSHAGHTVTDPSNAALVEQADARPTSERSFLSNLFSSDDRKANTAKKRSGPSKNLVTGLGAAVDSMVAKSPALTQTLDSLMADGWTIVTGKAGDGTYADNEGKRINIDKRELSNPKEVIESLAHEGGHGLYDEPYVNFGDLTKQEYVDANVMRHLRDEAAATIMNLRVRDELKANGIDITVAGRNAKAYEASWQAHLAGKLTHEQLMDRIANQYAEGERPSTAKNMNYRQYHESNYADHWDKHH